MQKEARKKNKIESDTLNSKHAGDPSTFCLRNLCTTDYRYALRGTEEVLIDHGNGKFKSSKAQSRIHAPEQLAGLVPRVHSTQLKQIIYKAMLLFVPKWC